MLTRTLLVALFAMLALPITASAQKVLRYSDHEPLDGMRPRFLQDVFFAAIEKESNGRLKIESQWDSKVSTGYDALRVIGDGKLAEMAVVVPEYAAKELPLHQLFKGFPVGPSGEKQVTFFRNAYAGIPELPAELEKNNVVQIFLATGYPVAFFSTAPLDKLKGLEGHSWRSASFWHHDFLRNAKATPVSMPWGEGVFKAMRDKTLDGLMVNVDSGYTLKIHEVAPNVLLSKDLWLGHLYVVAMNRNTWNGLAEQDRDAIRRAAETAYRQLGPVMNASLDGMVSDLKKAGARLRTLTPAEVEEWRGITRHRDVQRAWANDQQAKGVQDAVPVLNRLTGMLDAAGR